jgi:L-lactate dehydrogenase complex protein LldE
MQVALFATCLVDLMRPSVGFAAVKLLERAGCQVEVPLAQTCCGQPAFNNGDFDSAATLARQVIDLLDEYPFIVVPSASCCGMIRVHYPRLLAQDAAYHSRAQRLAGKVYELTEFLVDICGQDTVETTFHGHVTYHDSCSSLRETGTSQPARRLLTGIAGLQFSELPHNENCCGFGGTFCVKYPEISTRMADDKIETIEQSGADTLLAADLGCLLNLAGRLQRRGLPVRVYHVAEVLAGDLADGGIGAEEDR